MAKFSDLEAASQSQDPVPVDFGNLPEQFSMREPLPQPGKGYVWKMQPISLEDDIWEELQTDAGPRIAVTLNPGTGRGLIIQQSPTGNFIGQQVRARFSNKERDWEGNEAGPGSDMAYLIRALRGADLSNKPSMAYAQELVRLSKTNTLFSADLEFSGQCNPKNDIYKINPATDEAEEVPGTKGCGQRYAMQQRKNKRTGEVTKKIPQDGNGVWQQRFECKCGALVGMFANLTNFQKYPPENGQPEAAK